MRYSILVGQAMFTIEPSTDRSGGVNVSVSTDVGSVDGTRGSWTVNCDADRTSVAVGEGSTDVSIGGGATTANGTGGRFKCRKGRSSGSLAVRRPRGGQSGEHTHRHHHHRQ